MTQIPPVAVAVNVLAPMLSKTTHDVCRALRRLGEWRVTANSMVDPDTAELVALELGLRAVRTQAKEWQVTVCKHCVRCNQRHIAWVCC